MNAHVPRIDNSPSPLVVSLSLSLSLLQPVSFHARLIYEAFSRRRRGNRVAITDDRTKRNEETGGKASSAAPTRGNSREPLWRNRRNGRWLVKVITRPSSQERDRRKFIVIISSIFSFFLAAMMRITLKVLGIILHDETLRIIILNNRGIFILETIRNLWRVERLFHEIEICYTHIVHNCWVLLEGIRKIKKVIQWIYARLQVMEGYRVIRAHVPTQRGQCSCL